MLLGVLLHELLELNEHDSGSTGDDVSNVGSGVSDNDRLLFICLDSFLFEDLCSGDCS